MAQACAYYFPRDWFSELTSTIMDTFPFTHNEDSAQHSRWIPTELLIAIFEEVESSDDLLVLATASRRFHNLAMVNFFARYKFDPFSRELKLDSLEGFCKVLEGLAVYIDLVGSSIYQLSYNFGYTRSNLQLLQEVRLLTRYVSKLSSVSYVTLTLAAQYSGDAKQWKDIIVVLLNTILARSCRGIHIMSSQLSSFHEEPKNMPPSSKPVDWLKDYWPSGHSPPNDGPKLLKSCFVQTFPRFLRPFYFHTFNTNAPSITNLSFKNLFGGGADWATMLASLHFPNLQQLKIIYGVIARDPLVKFLARHPGTITNFEYHHIRYEPRSKSPMRGRPLEPVFQTSLETLTTSPEHVMNFVPSFSSLKRLRDVEIKIEELMTQSGNANFTALEGALRVLEGCTNRITLTLSITHTGLGFGTWFTQIFAPTHWGGSRVVARPESKLHCVETLVMDNGNWGFTDALVTVLLPRWLVLFPQLRVLMLRGGRQSHKSFAGNEDSTSGNAFVTALKEACPDIYIEYSIGHSYV